MASKALPRWLVFAGCLRLFSVYLGYFDPDKFKIAVYNVKPFLVNGLQGRTFAAWTLLSSTLCIICSRQPKNRTLYGATLFSFFVALAYLSAEVVIFETMSWKTIITPGLVAVPSVIVMSLGIGKLSAPGPSEANVSYSLLLTRWLQLMSAVNLYRAYVGYFNAAQLTSGTFDLQPSLVNELEGRTFGIFSFLVSGLCAICSAAPTNVAVYGATLISSALSLLFMMFEHFLYETVSMKAAGLNAVLPGLTFLYMAAGWNHYTKGSKAAAKSD